MRSANRWVAWGCVICLSLLSAGTANARQITVNVRSAILIDMTNGNELFEQNADALIPPASITKVLSLYLVFEAMQQGRIHPWDQVLISKRAASAPPTKMGLKAGQRISLDELIKGMAVISGNDASIAVAEHVSGTVENFVRLMNIKARRLGMYSSKFMTPNGLPAKGQLTTARDLSRLSIAYLRRFPESLGIHSMQTYTYNQRVRRNPNRLLGKCPGVDGLKTGFVCASGYNLSATAKREDVRLLAVVLGARSAAVRAAETRKLLEMGFKRVGVDTPEVREVRVEPETDEEGQCSGVKRYRIKPTKKKTVRGASTVRRVRHTNDKSSTKAMTSGSSTARGKASTAKAASTRRGVTSKSASVVKRKSSRKLAEDNKGARRKSSRRVATAHKRGAAASAEVVALKGTKGKTGIAEGPASSKGKGKALKPAGSSGKAAAVSKKHISPQKKRTGSSKGKKVNQPARKSSVSQQSDTSVQMRKDNKG